MKAERKPTTDDIALQKEVICAYIDRERDGWLAAKAMDERASGHSAGAITARQKAMKRIDGMLDELIQIPGVMVEPTSGVGWPE